MGEEVLLKMKKIDIEFGYCFSAIYTNTELHGIPQRRIPVRTFYFYWLSDAAPVLQWKMSDCKSLIDYLNLIPKNATHQAGCGTEFPAKWTSKWYLKM